MLFVESRSLGGAAIDPPTLHGEQYLNINQICVDAPLTHDQQTPDFSRLYNEVLHVGRLTILKTMD